MVSIRRLGARGRAHTRCCFVRERQREGARRQTLYRHVKHVGGALLLVGLGLYMAYLGGFVEVPKRLERFQF